MNMTVAARWSRRFAPVLLGALIIAGGLLLFSLVMEFHEPAWSRAAIGLQLVALAIAFTGLRAHLPLSRRYIAYPLILAGLVYLWDTTLPPPTLPDDLRVLVPYLALLAIVFDVGRVIGRQSALAPAAIAKPVPVEAQKRVSVQQGLSSLSETATLFNVSEKELRARLFKAGRRPMLHEDRELVSVIDLLTVLGRWEKDGREL